MPGLHKNKENNYFDKPKKNTIFTPDIVSKKIADIIRLDSNLHDMQCVVDVCCGEGNLSRYIDIDGQLWGVDIVEPDNKVQFDGIRIEDYLKSDIITKEELPADLILCNPPFNWGTYEGRKECLEHLNSLFSPTVVKEYFNLPLSKKDYKEIRRKYSSDLLPEIFLKKIFDDFGKDVPLVLVTGIGLLLNNRIETKGKYKIKRYDYLRSIQDRISSTLILPLDIFPNVKFHACVLFLNFEGLKPMYFL